MTSKSVHPMIQMGPFRDYIPSNLYMKFNIGKMNKLDPIVGIVLAGAYFKLMLGKVNTTFNGNETELLSLVNSFKEKKFFLGSTFPLAIQVFSYLSNHWQYVQLKYFTLTLSSFSLLLIYMLFRRNNVSAHLAVLGVIAIANLPHFQKESITLSVDTLFWFFFLGTLYFWRLYRIQTRLSILYLAHIGSFLGLAMSTKRLGFITWIWIICCSLYDTWNTIDDITVSTSKLIRKVMLKFFFIIMVPLQIFLLVNYRQINNFQVDSPEYSRYMSSYFQSYLRGSSIHTTSDQLVYFGDMITLRHMESLGGYLTSYNMTYDEEEEDQHLVTLSPNENSEWTYWIIENSNEHSAGKSVRNFDDIRLRHFITGKLLRASDSSPLVSEQEYDKMISCTGNNEYKGDSDENWTLQTVNFPKVNFHNSNMFNVSRDLLTLFNQGRHCTLLGHDTRLPEWAFYDQEVLCLDPATNNLATFQMKVIKSKNMTDIEITSFNKLKLIFEWLVRQYKYAFIVKDATVDSSKSMLDLNFQIESWPIKCQEDQVMAKNIWFLSLVGVVVFIMWQSCQILKWNPWNETSRETLLSLNKILYQDIGIEYALGWILHFYIYTKTPVHHSVDIINYFPSYLFGFFIFIQMLNTLYRAYPWIFVTLPIYIAVLCKIAY